VKINWKSVPLLQFALPFILGVTLYESTLFFSNFLFFSSFLNLLVLLFSISKKSYGFRWVYGFALVLLVFQLAIVLSHFSFSDNRSDYFLNFANENSVYLVDIIDYPQEKENSFQILAQVKSVDEIKTSGRLLIYCKKENSNPISRGDVLLLKKFPLEFDSPKNPNQFNYKAFLKRKNIGHYLFLNETDYEIVDHRELNFFLKKVRNLRTELLLRLKNTQLTEDEYGFASAILLGDRSELSFQMKSAFSATGSMHFLAVSGLHVGIIYLFLAFLFPFSQDKRLAFLSLLSILLLLWTYALLCGMSISVVRAVLMLSFVSVAKYLDKNSNIINTILLSAFILLMVYPYNLFDVGFQLSYVAVIGIVLLYPKLFALMEPRFVFTRWIWKVVCLSLSAQIATVGLSVYYFHQFPNYFLLSNLLLFPLVPIVLFSGILFFVFSWLPFVNDILFYVLQLSIRSFNRVVVEIETLPFSLSDFLYFEKVELLLIYIMVFLLVLFLYFRRFLIVNIALLFLIVFQTTSHSSDNSQIVFYSIKGHSAILFYEENKSVLIGDTVLLKDNKKMDFNLDGSLSKLSVKNLTILTLNDKFENNIFWKDECHFQFLNKKGLIVNDSFEVFKSDSIIPIDYCVISKNIDIAKLSGSYDITLVILDAALPAYISKKLEKKCQELELNYHNLKKSSLVNRF